MTMAHTTSRLPFGAITVHRVVSFSNELIERFHQWSETRRTVAQLRALSPQQLDDIGLTQADIDDFERKGRF